MIGFRIILFSVTRQRKYNKYFILTMKKKNANHDSLKYRNQKMMFMWLVIKAIFLLRVFKFDDTKGNLKWIKRVDWGEIWFFFFVIA